MIRVQSSDLEQEPVYIYVSKYLTGFRVNRKVLSSSAELKRRGLPPPLSVSSTLISSLSPIKSPPKKITNQHSTTNNPRTVIYKNPFKKEDEDFPSGSDNNDEYQLRHEFDNQFRGLKLYNP
ncbi:hypothetical protein Pst134EA_028216 [Puccinia striiformis f. sp. tritici]|uniref:hypothetical protein n=1 Tax=Puccinia striiformis f. sp. tritici TaxID=168172 RepID=UPI0020080274|nr:hypothetical protein Pst134EA_028216 [Puccinia striiformis f. sp. tritici]KAH9448927.1 hypothetical protein Pst134EA_028216 [Puccinia striiformis f. sp. tritici]